MADQTRGRRDLSLTPTSDEELDAISEVGPADAARAEAEWRRVSPAAFKAILDATAEG